MDKVSKKVYQHGLREFRRQMREQCHEMVHLTKSGNYDTRTWNEDSMTTDNNYKNRRSKFGDTLAKFNKNSPLPPSVRHALNNCISKKGLNEEAPQVVAHFLVGRILSGEMSIAESYSDSIQTPLQDNDETRFLRCMWKTKMDFHPSDPNFHHLSNWMKVIWSGDYKGFLKMLEHKSEAEVKRMIERRETLLHISAIFYVLDGANRLFNDNGEETGLCKRAKETLNVKNEHMKILIKLISLGADVNVHDVTGKTPLHYCCSILSNSLMLKLAQRLVNAGADVNAKNRVKATPLMEVTLARNFEFMEFLIHNGADPNIKDFSGMSPRDFSLRIDHTAMINLFSDGFRNAGQKVVKDKCSQCSLEKEHLKKCTGCYHSWYCSSQCQRQDWDKHKLECNTIRMQYKLCTYGNIDGQETQAKALETKPLKEQFIVKVQIDHSDEDAEIPPMIIVNKDKSFQVKLEKENNATVFDELYQNIVSHGHKGRKGYFHVIRKKNAPGKIEINSVNIQPSW